MKLEKVEEMDILQDKPQSTLKKKILLFIIKILFEKEK